MCIRDSFWDKYEKSNWFLEQIIATADQEIGSRKVKVLLDTPQQDGGQWDMVVSPVSYTHLAKEEESFPEVTKEMTAIMSTFGQLKEYNPCLLYTSRCV